ncbi:MAG: hypothetical protein ACJASQ_003332 [Crocinitomicaceae bacterium]|jgi:hypothetical protein
MKNTIIILVLLFINSPALFAGSSSVDPSNTFGNPGTIARDSLVDISYKMINNKVYFKLTMINESKDGFYSMVREFGDGRVESVDIRQMNANMINVPLLYCFVDEEIPSVDFTYVLRRISDEVTEVSRWNYCSTNDEICPVESIFGQLAIH